MSSWQIHQSYGASTQQYWIATEEIEANDFRNAWQLFWDNLGRIVPRICLVSQCYAEFLAQPILILRKDSDTAFIRCSVERNRNALRLRLMERDLMFMEQEQKALKLLLDDSQIPDQFFWYWNDSTNSSNYTSRLLLMLSAVETLVNKPTTNMSRPEKDWNKLSAILGHDLKKVFWGEKGQSYSALRHSLIHGRYFPPDNETKDPLGQLYKRIITYFNERIFGEQLLNEHVIHPQRHPFGNREGDDFFIRPVGNAKLALADVIADMGSDGEFTHYERIVDDQLWSSY